MLKFVSPSCFQVRSLLVVSAIWTIHLAGLLALLRDTNSKRLTRDAPLHHNYIQIQSQPILEKAKRENRGLTSEEVASLNGMITVQIDTAFERSKTIVTEAVHVKEGDTPAQAQAKVEIGRSLLSFLGRAFLWLKESLKSILSQLWRGLIIITTTGCVHQLSPTK